MIKNYRKCPYCSDFITVDKKTKRRQAIFLLLTLGSLVLTILWYFQDSKWFIPAMLSYLIIGVFLYWANKRVLLVPYEKDENDT